MEFYPAVDIQRGRVARAAGIGRDDPFALAEWYHSEGAVWVHVVDLDRALGTGLENTATVLRLCALDGVAVQVGGNLTEPDLIGACVAAGARRVVLGTEVLIDPDRLNDCLAAVDARSAAVALEVRDRRLHLRSGRDIGLSLQDAGQRIADRGIRAAVYRDLDRDGRLWGVDVPGARELVPHGIAVIAAGGTATLDELRAARAAGLHGVIAGRALLDGRFTMKEALACCG